MKKSDLLIVLAIAAGTLAAIWWVQARAQQQTLDRAGRARYGNDFQAYQGAGF